MWLGYRGDMLKWHALVQLYGSLVYLPGKVHLDECDALIIPPTLRSTPLSACIASVGFLLGRSWGGSGGNSGVSSHRA